MDPTVKYATDWTQKTSEAGKLSAIVQSFCLRTFCTGISYFAGLENLRPYWLFGVLVIIIYRDYWRLLHKFKQQVAISIASRNEKQMIIHNINWPIPWIYFTDIDNCECANRILCYMWPKMTKYTEKVIKNTIEPRINKAMSAYKKNPNFKFHTFRFGSTAPRICGLKVFKKFSRLYENVILDIRLYYAGDTEIYFYLMNIGGGVQNLEMTGWIRVILKLIAQPRPLLKGIEIFFLHEPRIDYNFMGAMDILEIPGVSGLLHRTIYDQINLLMVLPNKLFIDMSDARDSSHWKCPEPEGLFRIHVIEAKDLKDSGSEVLQPDTYVIVTFGGQTALSKPFLSSLDPQWNFWANFMIDCSFEEYCLIDVNERSVSGSLGKVSIDLDLAKEKKFISSWVQLEETTTGMVHLNIYYYNLSYKSLDYSNKLPFALIVFVNTASIFINPKNKTPNLVVSLSIGEDTKFTKSVISENPVFEEAFLFVINDHPSGIKLTLNMVDNSTKAVLGKANLPLKRVFEADCMEIIDQLCPLMGSVTESSLSLSMRLRVLKI